MSMRAQVIMKTSIQAEVDALTSEYAQQLEGVQQQAAKAVESVSSINELSGKTDRLNEELRLLRARLEPLDVSTQSMKQYSENLGIASRALEGKVNAVEDRITKELELLRRNHADVFSQFEHNHNTKHQEHHEHITTSFKALSESLSDHSIKVENARRDAVALHDALAEKLTNNQTNHDQRHSHVISRVQSTQSRMDALERSLVDACERFDTKFKDASAKSESATMAAVHACDLAWKSKVKELEEDHNRHIRKLTEDVEIEKQTNSRNAEDLRAILGSLAGLRSELNNLQQDAVTAKDHRDATQRLAERNRISVDASVDKMVALEDTFDNKLERLVENLRCELSAENASLRSNIEAGAQQFEVKIEKSNAHAASLERALENMIDRIESAESATTDLSRSTERCNELIQREIKQENEQQTVRITQVSEEVLKQVADLRVSTGDAIELVKEQAENRGHSFENKLSSLSNDLASFRSNTALVEKETADILARETLAREQQAEITGRQLAQLFASSTRLEDELKSQTRAGLEQNALRESIFSEHKSRVLDDLEALRTKHNSLDDAVATQVAEIFKNISETQSDWSAKLRHLEAATSSTAMDNFGKLSAQLRSLESRHDEDKQRINSVRAELERSNTVSIEAASNQFGEAIKRAEERLTSNLDHAIQQLSVEVKQYDQQQQMDRDRFETALATESSRNQDANAQSITSLGDVHTELSQRLSAQKSLLESFMASASNTNTKIETQLASHENQSKAQLREIDQAMEKIATLKSEISSVDRKHFELTEGHRDQLASAKVELNAAMRAEAESLNKRLEQLADAHEQGLDRLGRVISDASSETQIKLMDLQRHATTEVHTSASEFDTKLVSQGEKFLFKLKSIETDVEERFQQAVARVANVQERVTDAHVAAIGKLEGLISASNTTLSDRVDHADKRQSQLENSVTAGHERLEKLSNMESAKVLSEVRTLRTDVYRALKESAKTLADWQEEIRYAKTSTDEAKEDCRSMRSVIDTRFTQVLKPLHQVCIQLGINPSGMLMTDKHYFDDSDQNTSSAVANQNFSNNRSTSAGRCILSSPNPKFSTDV